MKTITVLAKPAVACGLAAQLGALFDTVIDVRSPASVGGLISELLRMRADLVLQMTSCDSRLLRRWLRDARIRGDNTRFIVLSCAELETSLPAAIEAVLPAA